MALISDEDSATARRWKWKKSSTHNKKNKIKNLSQDLNTVYLWLQAYKKKKEEEKKASLLKLGSMGWLDVSA